MPHSGIMHLSQAAIPTHVRSNTLILKTIAVGPLQTNCYVIGCPETLQGAIIDPGWDASTILAQAKDAGLTIQYVLNTHAHWDHIGANADVLAATDAQLAIHPNELPLLHQNGGASMFGVSAPRSPEPDVLLEAGQALQIGQIHLQVLFTPGHTAGHVSFYAPQAGVVFDGDVLFRHGIGRSDLPGGSHSMLMHSIREVLLTLPPETVVYCGHGPSTTVGEEQRANPWL